MTSCRNIDLGTMMMACGCGRRQFPSLAKTVCKFTSSNRSYGGLVGSCKAVPTKSKEISLLNGMYDSHLKS